MASCAASSSFLNFFAPKRLSLSPSIHPSTSHDFTKSLSCLLASIILVAPNATVFLVHGTGFITSRAPKSSP